ncbi:MAG: PPC domain-containing protein [Planctomycetaceae bacterium]|nr:PPC domain-containing protein [Planctomycetaceae bacterium]
MPGFNARLMALKCLCTLALLSCLTSVHAADPDLTRITPYGGQTGQEVAVVLNGDRLDDSIEIISYDPGLQFSDFTVPEGKNGKEFHAKITIPQDCPLGAHRLRIRTKSGLSRVIAFFVGQAPVVDEKEPNTDFYAPQAITTDVTMHGRIDSEDVDYFTLDCKKGERLSVEVEGLRLGTYFLGSNFFDPYVAILNADRFELAACDDHALTRQDGFVSVIIPEDGKYVVEVRDSSYGGHGAALYRLHIGQFPRPTGTVPAGGKPGELLNVKMYGDIAGPFDAQVQLPTQVPLEYSYFARQGNHVSPTGNRFWISPLENVIETEPNESREQATVMSVPSAANGILLSDEDIDYFKFTMTKDQEVDIDVIARRVRSAMDSVINVYDANGRRLAGDDDRKRPDSYLRFKAPADGEYFFQVQDQLGKGGADFHYRVEVTPVVPKMTITANEEVRYVQPDIELPQGRRVAFLASIQRENFGGAVKFLAENLPAGVTMECPESWSATGVVPLMFTAQENVELGSQFTRILGQWQNPGNAEQVVTAPLEQHHMRIRGQNQNDYVWEEAFDQIPVAITEKTPFDVEIIQPKVPIVRSGVMNLKVVAKKDEGFDEDISVVILQNAPGVNSSRSVKIPKGQTEALIPLNAAGNAPIQESAITVTATARVGNGNISINTPFAMLRVAEPYVEFKYVNTAVEQGQVLQFPIEIVQKTPFEGTAKVRLIGLPAKTATEEKEITKETTELVFPVTTEAEAPVGEHKNLFCQLIIIENGEEISHNLGGGRMRINKPAPIVVPQKAPPKPEEPKPEEPKPKVLSRLEMLRQQQEAIRNQQN